MSDQMKPLIAIAAERNLNGPEAEAAFDLLFNGEATDAQIGALLMAMRVRGERVTLRSQCEQEKQPHARGLQGLPRLLRPQPRQQACTGPTRRRTRRLVVLQANIAEEARLGRHLCRPLCSQRRNPREELSRENTRNPHKKSKKR